MPFIDRVISKLDIIYNHRFFIKQWMLGFAKGDIRDIIRRRSFDLDIKWMDIKDHRISDADPFVLDRKNGKIDLLIEYYDVNERCGKLAAVSADENFCLGERKIVLDTQSHLSYPFIFRENEKVYIFPESSAAGYLSCYEYDPEKQTMQFVKHIKEKPLLDSVIFRYKGVYWIITSLRQKGDGGLYELHIYYADSLLGEYTPHPGNPVKSGLNGIRGAGGLIEVDGELYLPTQNCEEDYGKEIAINRITRLSEQEFDWEHHMTISIDPKRRSNKNMRKIHTLNTVDDLIVVDGQKWMFSLLRQNRIANKEKAYLKKQLKLNQEKKRGSS